MLRFGVLGAGRIGKDRASHGEAFHKVMPGRKGQRMRRTGGQRGGAIGGTQTFCPDIAEVAAIERLGRLALEKWIGQEGSQRLLVDAAGGGDGAIVVKRAAGMAQDPSAGIGPYRFQNRCS